MLAVGVLPDVDFGMVERAEADVSAFARQRGISAPAVGDEARDAQTCARADDGDGGVFHGGGATHLQQLALGQVGNGKCLRREVVQQDQGVQFQRLPGRLDGKGPVVIGHLHPVADDGVGDGNGRVLDEGLTGFLQIGADGSVQAVVVLSGQGLDVLQLKRGNFQCKSGVGSADIGNQAGPVAVFLAGFGSGHENAPCFFCTRGFERARRPSAAMPAGSGEATREE